MIERLAMVCKSTDDEKFVLVSHKSIVNMLHKVNEIVDKVNELEELCTESKAIEDERLEIFKGEAFKSFKNRLPEKVERAIETIAESFKNTAIHVEGDTDKASVEYVGFGKWISVKDRLPEIGTEIACLVQSKLGNNPVVTTTYKGTFDFWDSTDFTTTHWFPLPKRPEVGVE